MFPYYVMSPSHALTSQVLNNASNASDCPEGNQVIWNTFDQCIYTTLDWVSFAIGLLSIACWLVVLMPQIVENCKNINCVASISPGLLLSWIFGDSTNLVGAFLTKQGLFQVLLGVWFVLTDLIMMAQLIFYHCVAKRRNRGKNALGEESKRLIPCIMGILCLTATFSGLHTSLQPEPAARLGVGRQLLSVDVHAQGSPPFFKSPQEILGYILGIISSIAYFISRSCQIYKNYTEKNVKGLSTMTFVMAVLGNLFYGLGIVLYSVGLHYTLMHLPWLLGSWGIMGMDCFIVFQIKAYGKEDSVELIVEDPQDENAPLINSINSDMDGYGTADNDRPVV